MAVTLTTVGDKYYAHEATITTGTCDGVNTVFTLAKVPMPTTLSVFNLSGLRLKDGTDYTRSGATITLTVAPESGDNLLATYYTLG